MIENTENNEKSKQPEGNSFIKRLRTYKGDVANLVKKRKTSLVGIALAEQKRRIGEAPEEESSKKISIKNIAFITGATILVVAGIAAIVFLYISNRDDDTVPRIASVEPLIFFEEQDSINITGLSRNQILNILTIEKEKTELTLGSIKHIYFTKDGVIQENGERKEEFVSASNFLNAIEARLPSSFLRTLKQNFMFGIHVFDGNQPFLILKTGFFENAFAGMLEWENYMNEDLAPLFGPKIVSSGIRLIEEESPITFKDIVIKNKDVRTIIDESTGKIILMYSFIDKETIAITTNEHTFREIFSRMTTSRVFK